jgi:hypothetical protein
VRVELCLGRFERAHELAADAHLDARLSVLVDRAWETRRDPSVNALAARALEALRGGDVEKAMEWVELGRLRGDEEMGRIGALLEEPPDASHLAEVVHRLEKRAGSADPVVQ